MSRILIRTLAGVRQEFEAARAALFYTEKQWSLAVEDITLKGVTKGHVSEALSKVEQTYLIRLFSEFEGMLRGYLQKRSEIVPSKAYDLVNKVAKPQRANVPDNKRVAVHLVREYRNAIVHDQGSGAVAVSFDQALSALNQYLVFLPDP